MSQDMKVFRIGEKILVTKLSDPFFTRTIIQMNHPYTIKIEAEKHEVLGYTVVVEVSTKDFEEKTPYHSIYRGRILQHVYKGKEAEKRYNAIMENLEKLSKTEEL